MTIAEHVAVIMGDDGEVFEVDNRSLEDVAAAHGAVTETSTDGRRVRMVFSDGSAIVIVGDAWDVEGETPFSWKGA